MTLDMETRLRDALEGRADQAEMTHGIADPYAAVTAGVRRDRRRRAGIGAASVTGILALALATTSWLSRTPAPDTHAEQSPTTSRSAISPGTTVLGWTPRGSLAADAAFMSAMTAKIAAADASARIVYAGDIDADRVVLTVSHTLQGPSIVRGVEAYVGRKGALPQDLVPVSGGYPFVDIDAISYATADGADARLLILTNPDQRTAYVSDEPVYHPDGVPTRAFRAVPLDDGLAVTRIESWSPQLVRVRAGSADRGVDLWHVDGPTPEPDVPAMVQRGDTWLLGTCTHDVSGVADVSVTHTPIPTRFDPAGPTTNPGTVTLSTATIIRTDGTAFRSVGVRSTSPGSTQLAVLGTCVPIPAATAGPPIVTLNEPTDTGASPRWLVVAPDHAPAVTTAEIRLTKDPTSALLGTAKFTGEYAVVTTNAGGGLAKNGYVFLRAADGTVMVAAPVTMPWDGDPLALTSVVAES